ncbi:MAG TPA: ABC transporter ATP-binding protein [Candidatus Sulfotelmatobacter sp.]|nr:ABC transporter ATP-binding protein [Candidatus Sulfotelmatobacter sp.]
MSEINPSVPAETARGAAVSVHGLGHTYRTGGETLTVLRSLELEVRPGGYVALTGPSGSGKTTLLSILGGLEPPTEGEVMVADYSVARLRGDRLAAFRRETVGFVFQHFGLLGALSAAENVELALALSRLDAKARGRRALELLALVGLEARATHLPKALSGGEKQRVAIARAMANSPRLILADEPTGNLDPDSGLAVMDHLEALRASSGCTVIVVSHNPLVAERADIAYRLESGVLRAA